MGKNDRIMMYFDSTYMKYQRNRMRELEQQRNILLIALAVISLMFIFMIHQNYVLSEKYIDSQDNVKSLQQMIIEKNDLITKQENELTTIKTETSSKVINAVKKLTGETVDRYTAVVYLEATNQGSIGMQLVADTIYNRTESDKFKTKTIAEVLLYPKQFNVLTKLNTIDNNVKQTEQYVAAKNIVENKLLYDTTISDDVLFFMNPEASTNTNRSWMRSRNLVIKYKNHEFYE